MESARDFCIQFNYSKEEFLFIMRMHFLQKILIPSIKKKASVSHRKESEYLLTVVLLKIYISFSHCVGTDL